MEWKHVWKGIVVLIFVLVLYSFNQRLLNFSPEDIRTLIYTAGWLAPVFYIVLFTLRPLVLFPASVFSIVGGLAFGAYFGSLLALIGAVSGAVLSFILARKYGERFVRKAPTGKMYEIKEKFEEKGFFYILMLRFLPVVNFDLISYSAGLSKVKIKDFIKATTLGIIPGTLIYNFLGASLVEGDRTTMIIVGTIYLIVIVVPVIWNKQIMKRIEEVPEKS
ncbi:TVP38/TMEM64 family protein [Halalkalibacillus sediminis]|uniref:TVP38/TMEM64 family membrane protein n=1 Tax=Halalkalibacillus sediminis TaxID=2018042 RepID=A0A2I0QVS8_9BACI|nr:TVP38/TMEM64 family protein [Halalkalibacillus sediminis]PKR78220.1 TVP38/TMEM64 family protein [Halalkalibacillus sediminis]